MSYIVEYEILERYKNKSQMIENITFFSSV